MATDVRILKAVKPLRPDGAALCAHERASRSQSAPTPNLALGPSRSTDCRKRRQSKLLSSTYLSQGAARPNTPYHRVAQHHHWTFSPAPHRGDPGATESQA